MTQFHTQPRSRGPALLIGETVALVVATWTLIGNKSAFYFIDLILAGLWMWEIRAQSRFVAKVILYPLAILLPIHLWRMYWIGQRDLVQNTVGESRLNLVLNSAVRFPGEWIRAWQRQVRRYIPAYEHSFITVKMSRMRLLAVLGVYGFLVGVGVVLIAPRRGLITAVPVSLVLFAPFALFLVVAQIVRHGGRHSSLGRAVPAALSCAEVPLLSWCTGPQVAFATGVMTGLAVLTFGPQNTFQRWRAVLIAASGAALLTYLIYELTYTILPIGVVLSVVLLAETALPAAMTAFAVVNFGGLALLAVRSRVGRFPANIILPIFGAEYTAGFAGWGPEGVSGSTQLPVFLGAAALGTICAIRQRRRELCATTCELLPV